jgi:carbamate kinase
VEAVVDKDASSALLASMLGADLLLLLTDVAGVSVDWGTPNAKLGRHTFAAGSMGPKVTAACQFVEEAGADAAIGALADAMAIVHGDARHDDLPARRRDVPG